MIDFAESQLTTLVCGAVIAAALLTASAFERSLRDALEAQAALDALASRLGAADCGPLHPLARIALPSAPGPFPRSVASVRLLADHLRALMADGRSLSSLRFPPLAVGVPLELVGALQIELAFDAFEGDCAVAVA